MTRPRPTLSGVRESISSAASRFSGPEPKGGDGVWEHHIIGLASYGPGIAPGHGIMFKGTSKPGTYKVYLDNLRIRHADGKATTLWANGKDTKMVKVAETELFKDLKIRLSM